jgi:hypothetical protein
MRHYGPDTGTFYKCSYQICNFVADLEEFRAILLSWSLEAGGLKVLVGTGWNGTQYIVFQIYNTYKTTKH